jgi:large subunit ribosomal protein L23
MREPYQVIRRPVVTEKSEAAAAVNRVVFEVDPRATKHQIARAVEKAFNVKVVSVHTLRLAGKRKRVMRGYAIKRGSLKKAVVTLAEGNRIDFYEGAKA